MQRLNSVFKSIKIISDHDKRFLIRMLAVLLLLSASFSFSRVEEPETIYYITYHQLTENLSNLIYDERADQYTVSGAPVSLLFDMERKVSARNYLYLDFYTASGDDTLWKLQFLNEKDKILAEQEIVLHQGTNEVILEKQSFWKVKLLSERETGETFRIENVELRKIGKDFLVKLFLLIFTVSFVFLCVIVILLYQKAADAGCVQLIAEAGKNIDAFLDVLGDTISWRFTEKVKRRIRTAIFLIMLLYPTYFQTQGTDAMVSYMAMHMWIMGGLLLILAGLSHEKRQSERDDSTFRYVTMLFVALVLVSDFFVLKKFRYAGFGMFFMGGLFARSWRSMEHPKDLLEEFKLAYKIYFVLGLGFCLIARPYIDGVRYSGYMTDASAYGIAMLAAAVIFLNDFIQEGPDGSHVRKRSKSIANGTGAVTALYLAWKTQVASIVLIEAAVIILSLIFWTIEWAKSDNRNKAGKIICAFLCLIAGAAVSICVQKLLYTLPYRLGTQKSFAMDVVETMDISIRQAVGACGWKRFFLDKLLICKSYMQKINLMGHSYLAKYNGEAAWPANSAVMNFYRYGIAAGTAYTAMNVLYLLKAVRQALKQTDFFLAGIAVVCVLAGMMETTEMPFLHLNWYLFWFGICCLFAVGRGERVLKYRD